MARFVTRGGLRVLMYHRFSVEPAARHVDVKMFRAHLEYIREYFNPVSMSQVLEAIRGSTPLPSKSVLVTVDDGYRDFVEVAYPLLREYRIPASLFVLAAGIQGKTWLWFDQLRHAIFESKLPALQISIDGTPREFALENAELREGAWDAIATRCSRMSTERRGETIEEVADRAAVPIPEVAPREYALATAEELRSLDERVVELGAHTDTHPILSQCSESEIEAEVVASRTTLERLLEREIRVFCYPSGMPGDFDERATEAVKRAGYQAATIAHGGICTPQQLVETPFLIPRMSAGMELEHLKNEINGASYLRRVVA